MDHITFAVGVAFWFALVALELADDDRECSHLFSLAPRLPKIKTSLTST
jgi:hypothetical protein